MHPADAGIDSKVNAAIRALAGAQERPCQALDRLRVFFPTRELTSSTDGSWPDTRSRSHGDDMNQAVNMLKISVVINNFAY
jgi:hypothetical protein